MGSGSLSLHVSNHGSKCAPDAHEQSGDTLIVGFPSADARTALTHHVTAVDPLGHLEVVLDTIRPRHEHRLVALAQLQRSLLLPPPRVAADVEASIVYICAAGLNYIRAATSIFYGDGDEHVPNSIFEIGFKGTV